VAVAVVKHGTAQFLNHFCMCFTVLHQNFPARRRAKLVFTQKKNVFYGQGLLRPVGFDLEQPSMWNVDAQSVSLLIIFCAGSIRCYMLLAMLRSRWMQPSAIRDAAQYAF